MYSRTRHSSLVLAICLTILPYMALSQHVCVYCRGDDSPPSSTTYRLACSRNATTPLNCPVTGIVPDCDNIPQLIPVKDVVDGCSLNPPSGSLANVPSYETGSLGQSIPVSQQQQSTPSQTMTFECFDTVIFQNLTWSLSAIIPSLACPDSGSIWTECSVDTPLCQPRVGIRAVTTTATTAPVPNQASVPISVAGELINQTMAGTAAPTMEGQTANINQATPGLGE